MHSDGCIADGTEVLPKVINSLLVLCVAGYMFVLL